MKKIGIEQNMLLVIKRGEKMLCINGEDNKEQFDMLHIAKRFSMLGGGTI